MRFPFLLIFVLFLPALVALGHDMYLFFTNHVDDPVMLSSKDVEEGFKFSALGFIWTNYEPESYKAVAASMSQENWAILDFLLTIKAFFAGLVFAGIIILPLMLLGLFGIGPMAKENKAYSGKSMYKRK